MNVTLYLDTPEHHPTSKMPRAIRELWYSNRREGLLSLVEGYGCPHSGCEHRFHFTAPRADVVAWLDLFVEEFPDCSPEVAILKSKIRIGFVQGIGVDSRGNMRLVLKTIQRQVGYNGELLSRPWFWTPEWEEK
ncbi:hypothetical protein OBP_218 [Pseudomonas phage OBP]|uniref:hypothetical protein n=1 Tax=Pseudomonas phage OBP TaxID=1124849 RepID=UPI000240D5BE|nr:hypothetical protein OBP_218 [Pseudomonas phage OBP]AEV89655.1 hypothetical protein OBP_218 [Pseudomonas phage OBP]